MKDDNVDKTKMAIEGMQHLGLPYWFNIELGIGKFIGAVLLILPFVPKRIKEWAYVGLGIDFLSAIIGLLAVDGASASAFSPLVFFAILLVSYTCYHKINDND